LQERAAVTVGISRALDDRPPPPVEAAAYYIVDEALTNACKHAQAFR
jgi:signal transduction histidine kinase